MALVPAFRAVSASLTIADEHALEQALAAFYQRARDAWPALVIPPDDFVRHVAQRVPHDLEAIAALTPMQAEDLYLACACLRGHPGALQQFESRIVAPVARAVSRGTDVRGGRDDFRQLLSERLLVGFEGRPPRLAGYGGRGPLLSWVRVAAVRLAINLRQAQRPDDLARSIELLAISTVAPDAELTLLRVQCRDEFRDAFSAALATLEVRERAVLRFHFLDGLTGETLARMYNVSRRTVHRWLQECIELLLTRTRAQLSDRLAMPPQELESLMEALKSELGSTLLQELGSDRR